MLCAGLSKSAQAADVVINEVMASNDAAVQNGASFPDWVELYNVTASPINLAGWILTDNPANLTNKFTFPTNTIIPAGGYVIVFCDTNTAEPGLHSGFSLNDKTDDVYLHRPRTAGGAREDFVQFGLQITDVSIGRVANGTGPFALTVPTPMAANLLMATGAVDTLKINEIMANPQGGDDWFELYNPATNHVLLSGLVWSDSLNPTNNRAIPGLSFISAGGFIKFIADDLDDGDNRDADHVDFKLANSGERLTLYRPNRSTWIDRVEFLFTQTNGVAYGRLPDGSANLVFFPVGRSTPGQSNFQLLEEIVINEILTHSDPPLEDAIELHNPWPTNVNISGWWLSDAKDDPKKFRIPANTIVPAGGYKVFYEWSNSISGFNSNGFGTNRSFSFSSARGDEVYLHTADAAGNIGFYRTSRDFGPAENGVSFGRYVTSDGKQELVAMSRRSFGRDSPGSLSEFRMGTGAANPYPKVGPLVINEVMYNPARENETNDNVFDEYIEIHNPGSTAVPLYDPIHYGFADGRTNTWRLRGVVDFNFPTNISVAAGEHILVVNFNPKTNLTQLQAFRSTFSVPTNVQIFGPYSSKLDNGGGSIELNKPDPPQPPDRGNDAYLVPYVRVEKVEYDDRDPWPLEPDAMGSALQRVHALGYGNDPTNWVAAAPSPGKVYVPNTPPTIVAIADVRTNEFGRITFFVDARDTNDPPQLLRYTLEGAPEGATIGEFNGLFKWRPTENQGPEVYDITVRVTDNGSPPQSSTDTFRITVDEVNRRPGFRIREQWVKVGRTLLFATAYDTDYPSNLVTHSVIGPAPAGLTIDSNSGVVTWEPTDAQAAATNLYRVTIEAFDESADPVRPSLTNQFTYTIHVLGATNALVWPSVSKQGDEVYITWESEIDKAYTVEYTDDLTPPVTWTLLQDGVIAEGPVMGVTDFAPFSLWRFYRVIEE